MKEYLLIFLVVSLFAFSSQNLIDNLFTSYDGEFINISTDNNLKFYKDPNTQPVFDVYYTEYNYYGYGNGIQIFYYPLPDAKGRYKEQFILTINNDKKFAFLEQPGLNKCINLSNNQALSLLTVKNIRANYDILTYLLYPKLDDIHYKFIFELTDYLPFLNLSISTDNRLNSSREDADDKMEKTIPSIEFFYNIRNQRLDKCTVNLPFYTLAELRAEYNNIKWNYEFVPKDKNLCGL